MKALQSTTSPGMWGNIRRTHGKAIVYEESWPNDPFPDDQTKEAIEDHFKVDLPGFELVKVSIN